MEAGKKIDAEKFITFLYTLVANQHGAEITITKITKGQPKKEKQTA